MVLDIHHAGEISFDNSVQMMMYETSENYEKKLSGKIEKRGGFSAGFFKHSYELDLDNDHTLAGLPSDDDWVLNSNYIDKTFLRHVISFELFREMSPLNIAPLCTYVKVKLNESYNGLYVLMQKPDRSIFFVDKNDPSGVVFKEPHLFRKTYNGVEPQDPENFHQQTYPDIEISDRSPELEEIRTLIKEANDDQFNEQIRQIFSIQNLIDWHLLILVTNNSDGILKNFYLYRQSTNTPFYISPWDYDHSFGRDGDNELNPGEQLPDLTRSILFSRLLDQHWYIQKLKERWNDLKDREVFSQNSLRNKIEDLSIYIKPFADENFELWPTDADSYMDDNGFDEEIQIMINYLSVRFEQLDEYFYNL